MGDFRPDGSWNPEASRTPKGYGSKLYWLVADLVTTRKKNPAALPGEYAFYIRTEAPQLAQAWPSLPDWEKDPDWPLAPARTSVEASVKYATRG